MVYGFMGRPRIIYKIIKIFQFIVIIIFLFYAILHEIQQLISNIDFWMKHMTFHVQLLKCLPIKKGGHVACGKTK